MGIYLNPDNHYFKEVVSSGEYVDKSGLLTYLNGRIGKPRPYVASSRPRRFGKSMAVNMICAYYSRGCDSGELFQALEIAKDVTFEQHLNQYDVICLDIQERRSIALQKGLKGEEILSYIQEEVVSEIAREYPEYTDTTRPVIADTLANINEATGNQFVIVIDEWDCFFREEKENEQLISNYIIFLRSLFKGNQADRFVKLAYITGILPIKKYGTQSALNNFRELTMIMPGAIAQYIGFTEEEVQTLCKEYGLPFAEMQKWYDGYYLNKVGHVYNPNSVMEAVSNEEFQSYWSQTETYESLKIYIEMNFDGLRDRVIRMLAGESCGVKVNTFKNDMTTMSNADDVLTLLIHLGYLAYDAEKKEAFIPNYEVRESFESAIEDGKFAETARAIEDSEQLIRATIAGKEDFVARQLEKVHRENISALAYNSEQSLATVILLAYYKARDKYTIIRELPTGEGFADMAFIPRRCSESPALLVELKWDKTAEGALAQIKKKKYIDAMEEYAGNLLLVGISYDKDSKKHSCRIERA